MSFDKYYPNRKDWRKPYRRSKAFDRSCRNHGGCGYCKCNRFHSTRKRELSSKEQLKYELNKEYIKDEKI